MGVKELSRGRSATHVDLRAVNMSGRGNVLYKSPEGERIWKVFRSGGKNTIGLVVVGSCCIRRQRGKDDAAEVGSSMAWKMMVARVFFLKVLIFIECLTYLLNNWYIYVVHTTYKFKKVSMESVPVISIPTAQFPSPPCPSQLNVVRSFLDFLHIKGNMTHSSCVCS